MTTIHATCDTAPDPRAVAALLELSDERDLWLRRLHAEYERGFVDGRACACVALAEMEHRREAVAHWRECAATLRRIIQNNADPSVRMRQVMAEIAADQKFMRDARARLATKPWTLRPLEWCAAAPRPPRRPGGCRMSQRPGPLVTFPVNFQPSVTPT